MIMTKPPSPCPSPRWGEGTPKLSAADSLSQLHPLADAATPECKLAEASLMGEGWGEGVFVPLSPRDVYRNLMEASAPGRDEFDAHVVACMIAVSTADAVGFEQPQTSAAGLSAEEFSTLIREFFPKAAAWRLFASSETVERAVEEACLLELLESCTTAREPFELRLAAMVARRAQRPNHLWQDLGLDNRGELSQLMTRHFKPLAVRNTGDMKWKKFFYRLICADASYTLCTAPSCAECDDFEDCFGEENGESLLARARRTAGAG